jgi:3-oxoadipyl-CoA thiolase
MTEAFLCDSIRTPFGRYGGALSPVRADELAAHVLRALMDRNASVDWSAVDDVVFGCANQAGEDNRNVARMAGLLAGLPVTVGGSTVNRLCGSGLDAIGSAARAIRAGDVDLVVAGGVESMSRAPFVYGKAETPFARKAEVFDTTLGWRFVNPKMKARYGVDSMAETGENVAELFEVSRADQDAFALRSQKKALAAQAAGHLAREISPVTVPGAKGASTIVERDEHPRETTIEALAALKPIVREGGTITAGNASGINDGAAAVVVASEAAAKAHGLTPRARVVGMAVAGVEPRIMGIGPINATKKVLARAQRSLDEVEVIELNEAFASQGLAVLRELGVADDDVRVNGYGGAIALGHPLGASGARLVGTALNQLVEKRGRLALCTMCIGVGQGIALLLERV